MRYGLAVVAGSLALAWTAASALSAQSEGAKAPPTAAADTNLRAISQHTTTAVSTPADGTAIAPAGAAGANGAKRPTTFVDASALNVKECHNLGGKVDFASGICPSGFLCKTVDNSGVEHRVCLSKSE
jgi:hypothetical protein